MDDKIIDESINNFMLKVNLEGQTCALKHSEKDPSENHQAVDYLVQNAGDQVSSTVTETLAIPICQECVDALSDKEWLLFYCVGCNRSQWLYKPLARRVYGKDEHIIFLAKCPYCYEEEPDK